MAERARPHSSTPDAMEPQRLGSVLGHVFESLPDGILLLDELWRIVYANRTARKISRIRPEDINSKTHWELYPETLGTNVEDTYREVMATRREGSIKAFYYEPFRIWLEMRVLPVPGDGIILYYRDITSAYLAEAALRESEERVRLALSASNGVGTWSWDVTNDRVYADTAFANLYGVDTQQASSGVPIAEFTRNILPEDLLTVGPAIEATLRDGVEFASQYRIRQAGGSVRWVAARGRCTRDASAAPLRFNGVVIDITEQKLREDELRRSEERYRILADLNPQLLWTTDSSSRVLYANQRFLDYIGRDTLPDDGNEILAYFDEADRNSVVELWMHSIATGEDFTIDARLIRSDGASRWWHLRAAPIRDEAGMIQQWLGSAVDIHEERTAAMRLREQYAEIDRQRRELETIYRGSPVGMALYEAKELRLIRINTRQAEAFRMSPTDAIGRRYEELTSGLTSAHALVHRAAAGEHILNQNIDGTFDRFPDEHHYWNVNYSPIFDEDGTVRAVAAAVTDITQQKRAETALIQSEKLAAVGRMASSIAHEINNPLESVTNLIYIARQQSNTPEIENLLDLADQELRRVSIITNQTLRFHKQATFPREITCEELFATVLSLYEGRLRNSSIAVEKRKRAHRTIACFEGDIRQVLNNLVGNAIDAMPQGGRLLLRSRETTDWRTGRRGFVLTIADTGAGMSPDVRAHVFEAFYTTKGINGTGLGLWIGNEIVARHDGRLLLRSSQGPTHRGTVFNLFLPFPPELPVGPAAPLTGRIQ